MRDERSRLTHAEDAGVKAMFGYKTVDFLIRCLQIGERAAFFIEIVGIDCCDGAGFLSKRLCVCRFQLKTVRRKDPRDDDLTVDAEQLELDFITRFRTPHAD